MQYRRVSYVDGNIASEYVVLEDDGAAFRAWFLFDKDGTVEHQLVDNLRLGRTVDELSRMADALQRHERHGESGANERQTHHNQ